MVTLVVFSNCTLFLPSINCYVEIYANFQSDSSLFYRSVDIPLEIKVIDKNDNAPIFEETKIIVRLFQDVRIRTVVAKVKVSNHL